MSRSITVFGATSGIAIACMRRWAAAGSEMHLVARSEDKLRQIADDLLAQGAARVETYVADLNDLDRAEAVVGELAAIERLDTVLVAHGTLPDQQRAQSDVAYAGQEFLTNGLNVILLLSHLANRLERQRHGTLAVISSVAGDRGRASNYVYGSAKAAVSAFCDGLRGRLRSAGVNVVVIKPGFVRTPMTAHLQLSGPLVATPDRVAELIVDGIDAARPTIYAPRFWRAIMFVIRHLPAAVAARMKA